jgi:tRNA A-37 threonylcarbamoyl transferase component Bud32
VALHLTAAPDDPDLLFLPWDVPLEEWPADRLVALPRGISRHVVRFVRLHGVVYAVKEVPERLAVREYRLLRDLDRLGVPAVDVVAVVDGRTDPSGEPLEPALVTKHLQFSLPYRALFSSTLRPDTANRLLDALSLLLVRLHVVGFSWNDCSLSNTLFRRDAGAFAAYLVDAETGELHPTLSDGQRAYDLEVAQTNIFGELSDLEAGGMLHDSVDPLHTSDSVVHRYTRLWEELTQTLELAPGERYRVDAHIRRLNDLGFDVEEMEITGEPGRGTVRVTPKVVDPGHHSRRLLRLTGLDVQENQARRLLNDLDAFRAALAIPESDEGVAAHRWVTEVFEPVVASVPKDQRGKLEPAEVFHEVLEHRWFLSEQAGHDVGIDVAAERYVQDVLRRKPVEAAVLGTRIGDPTDSTLELRLSFAPSDDDVSP